MIDAARGLAARNEAGEPLVVQELLDGGVLVLRLNRPEHANAWREEVELQYFAGFDRAVADPDVRAVVVTGTGKSFCPGMDIERLREITAEGRPYSLERRSQILLRHVPKPVIAAVNGACAGIGFVQALMADVRFTAREARWSAAFSRIGLVAEDGVARRLQQVAGDEVAADLLLSARAFDGDEAFRLRVASRVVPREELLEAAIDYARELASRSPIAMALIKRQLLLDGDGDLETARRRAVAYLAHVKTFPDYAEGIRASVERRAPIFAGLATGYLDPADDPAGFTPGE